MPKQEQKKVILCISNDIHTDQRLHKVCTSLKSLGYNVELLGRILPQSSELNRDYTCTRLKIWINKGPLFYAFLNIQFFFYLIFKSKDLIVANDLDTLPAGHLAAKLKRIPLIVDLHELFTEVPEVVQKPKVQQVWKKVETLFLKQQTHIITVCESIADFYRNLYPIELEIVRNIPVIKPIKPSIKKNTNEKIIIYQGAINFGRGIETMIDMMDFLPSDYKLWIIGSGDLSDAINQRVSKSESEKHIKCFGRLDPEELKKITQNADLGLSLEENIGLNYYYALPNKIFDYINAEIPVLVSPFPEMSRIVNQYEIGYIRKSENAEQLANEVLGIFKNVQLLSEKRKACKKAKLELTWNNEFKVYQKIVENALTQNQ